MPHSNTASVDLSNEGYSVSGVGVDWITCTTKPGPVIERMVELADIVATSLQRDRGHTAKGASILGYDGVQVGPLFYGERIDGGIIRASGATADDMEPLLRDAKLVLNISRIDLQVTVKFPLDDVQYASRQAYALSESDKTNNRGKPMSINLLQSFGGGDTLTFGKRSSARFIRIYDKTREQKGEIEGYQWRFEVEYKPPLSNRIWLLLGEVDNREQFVMGMVASELIEQGVMPLWDTESEVNRVKTSADRTDNERALSWLERQVKPTIERLIRDGYLEEVKKALRIDKWKDPD